MSTVPPGAVPPARLERALRSLRGLATGDALGERFFVNPDTVEQLIEARVFPRGTWGYTDDTVMALAVVENLAEFGHIEPRALALGFGEKYTADPGRGYGPSMHRTLQALHAGADYREVARAPFGGSGSMGNGGAMRAAPVGAFWAPEALTPAAELEAAWAHVAAEARLSAAVTHANPEGQAGAEAVAIAAAWVAWVAEQKAQRPLTELFQLVLRHTTPGETTARIERAASLPSEYDVRTAVSALGNGSQVLAQDTVPFCLWCVARHLGDYEAAFWATVSGLGDRDTTCAIVGGILASDSRVCAPAEWTEERESLVVMSRQPPLKGLEES
ncbi:MAG: ADP-ribosylglycohydrolase family protein [Polyangiaceae bacterium]|nr:ADP-ribosylglycohydrolase family protein [Polyangiaceae bacterium]MCB9607249.1 ADP-ribosylglycohydrolase family protein [Polyangiaceae bacterium]